MSNRLIHASSPYLRQHADNPVDWYPWGEEAFEKAKRENKPIFLSIGYSTCHWCHVMARECFADAEVAALLNESFVSVKVDREERPDIDSIYMSVCQAFTGSGGWPTSVFMTWEQKPFFAGTYFPKQSRHGRIGFMELLLMIREKWESDRLSLQLQAEHIVQRLRDRVMQPGDAELQLADVAVRLYQRDYDATNGGFGAAPKFPAPHNLLFMMEYAERMKDRQCMEMAEHTLMQMYRGGLFDHIGYGFSRYSTDEKYLVPHFEKMLYDNAMLILAYCKAYSVTKKTIYRDIAGKTADYILREMTSPAGGYYSAQDADSDGQEGKYYVFTPREISTVLGEDKGRAFCALFDVTESGNFEGSSIPNLLQGGTSEMIGEETMRKLREYRKQRCRLHLDNKILTSWNGLMIAAMCRLYSVTRNQRYLESAKYAEQFVREQLLEGDTLFVSICDGVRSGKGFLDDYAAYIFALLALHGATLEESYFERAQWLCCKVLLDFKDLKYGGFFLYGHDGEHLITRPKELYDGAMPSGNSLMAWNLVRLYHLNDGKSWGKESEQQLRFLAGEAERYPSGYAMFLLALLQWEFPPAQITVVPKQGTSTAEIVAQTGMDAVVTIRDGDESYPMKNDQTTYYVCADGACFPPVNRLKSEAEIL